MPIRIDPDLVAALERTPGPCRVSVRSAVRQPVLEAALAAAARTIEGRALASGVGWHHAEAWVGEVLFDFVRGPGRAAEVVAAIAFGVGQVGVRDADLLAIGALPAPAAPAAPTPEGVGSSRTLNGLAEAVASAYDRAGDAVGARRAREAAAGASGAEAMEDGRRRAVLGLVLRQWLPAELEAAGATVQAAVLRALPNPATDANAVLEAVGQAVLASVDRLAATPRAAVMDLESAYAVGRDLHDVTWGCAGEQGRAGEALVDAARARPPSQPGQVLWSLATTGTFQRLLPFVEALGPDALERWRRISREERTLHTLVVKTMGATTATARRNIVNEALSGAVASAGPEARTELESALERLPTVAWSLALCTGWEAAGERCRHVVARVGAEGRTALTARDGATAAVMHHVAGLIESGAELLHRLSRETAD